MVALKNAVVLVTGANGGLGREFVRQALAAGVNKVYATARAPRTSAHGGDPRVVPLALDVTDRAAVVAAAALASDVTIVINNAGASNGATLLADDLDAARRLFEVNFFGPLEVANAFVPVLAANGGGALVNVLSVLSWLGTYDAYSATKAALWSATNTQRLQLAQRSIQVMALHLGATDTPMAADVDEPKGNPADVVCAAYAGLEAGQHEVLADESSRRVRAGLSGPLEVLYPELAAKSLT